MREPKFETNISFIDIISDLVEEHIFNGMHEASDDPDKFEEVIDSLSDAEYEEMIKYIADDIMNDYEVWRKFDESVEWNVYHYDKLKFDD